MDIAFHLIISVFRGSYPKGLYDSPVLKGRLSQSKKGFPQTEKACSEVLSLPVHPLLSKADIARVIKTIKAFMK
jgi:dTDP-4-amino-4,6-dideoxygalactose transaminase